MVIMWGSIWVSETERESQVELVVAEAEERCVEERVEGMRGSWKLVGWKEGIGRWWRKGRTYRKPLRHERVSKKIRMKLRRRIAEVERKAAEVESVERERVTEERVETGRWG